MARQVPVDPPPGPQPVFAAAVYVDTSVLRQLPADLSNPDLARLNDVTERLHVEKFIPAIVRDEWVVAHQGAARKKRQEMLSAVRALDDYLGEGVTRVDVPPVRELDHLVERAQVERLGAAGFIGIPTPPADVNELLHLAVRVVKPFADEDRGFRDAMIVRTISEHARRFEGAEVLVISRDDVFNHPDVRGQWEAVGVHPAVVKSFQLAADCLEAGLDAAVKQAIDEDIATITDFLRSRQREIFDRLLKDVEVSEAFIRGAFLQDPAYFGTLERVRQVRPIEITRVSHGHVLRGRHGREGQRRPVTFYVKVAFDITVGQIPFTQLLSSGPRVRLDAVDQPVSSQVFLTSDMPQQASTDMTVEREIVVEAWVTEDEGTGGLVGLDIEKITTW